MFHVTHWHLTKFVGAAVETSKWSTLEVLSLAGELLNGNELVYVNQLETLGPRTIRTMAIPISSLGWPRIGA